MPLSKQRSIQIVLEEFAIRVLTLDYMFIRRILRKEFTFNSNDKILDIGSGTGILCSYFPAERYMGIDIDKDLIYFAQKKHPEYRFFCMDAGNLAFPNHSFSKVLLVGAIHHIDDETLKKMFTTLQKILKKNSLLLAIEPIPSHWYNILGRLLRAHDKGHHILGYEDYAQRMAKYFTIKRTYKQSGGLIDYGIFVLKNTKLKK